jgi:HAD superfamily hydrolase (TIGR01490 family)
MKLRKFAAFDIDGTIFRSSLLIKLVDELIAQKLFPTSCRRYFTKAHQNWLNREEGYEAYIAGVVKAYDTYLRGVPYKKFLAIADKVVAREKSKTYTFTRDLVGQLKAKGYFVMAISHSPKPAVEVFAKALGFSKVYGIMYETDNRGRLTGNKLHTDIIFQKEKILHRAMEKESLTLKGSVGVGDTDSDISFLKLVDRPICFNPNKALYQYAKKHKWEVVVERKDVIYHL